MAVGASKICGRAHPRMFNFSWVTRKCIWKERDGECAEGYHLGEHPDRYQWRKTRTRISKEREEVSEEPAKGPIKQDFNTRREWEVAQKAAIIRKNLYFSLILHIISQVLVIIPPIRIIIDMTRLLQWWRVNKCTFPRLLQAFLWETNFRSVTTFQWFLHNHYFA